MTARTDLFPMLFTPGAVLASKKGKKHHEVMLQPIGMLHLPSGRLVTGDAIGTIDFQPLSRTVPPGIYPVEASVVTVSADEARIAAVRILFSREPVVTWEIAEGGSVGAPGYTGPLGLFIDAQILPALQVYIDSANSPDEWWYDPPKTDGKAWEVACFTPDDDRPETCVLFHTNSYNDGPFVSHWGLDAMGAPAMLVTEFNLVA
jgi:hypothetical protein